MGCRNACICSGRCSESCYEAEKYCGEAEDIYDELHGKSKEEEEYYKTDAMFLTCGNDWKEVIFKAEQFIKDSEVKK